MNHGRIKSAFIQVSSSISSTIFFLYLKIELLFRRSILKLQTDLITIVSQNAYIQSFDLFPYQNLKSNSDLAFCVRFKLFDLPDKHDPNVNEALLTELCDKLSKDEWVRKQICFYYLLEKLYYTFGISSEMFTEKASHAIDQAALHYDFDEQITTKNIGKYKRTIKKDKKRLQKEMEALTDKKVDEEKLKRIKPISIQASHLTFGLSLFSSLFILGGIIYVKGFFWHFDVDVGNFFGMSDYFQSSLDNIVSVAIVTAISFGFLLYVIALDFGDQVRFDLFEEKYTWKNSFDIPLAIFVSGSTYSLVKNSYIHGSIDIVNLTLLLFFISVYFLSKLRVFRYFKNPFIAIISSMALLVFVSQLWLKVVEDVASVKDGTFRKNYNFDLSDKYSKFEGSQFVSANSNYVFLWNSNENKIQILPISAIQSLEIRPAN